MVDPKFTYDVALSFAGEQRDQANQLATILEQMGVRVYYDEFQQAELWGKDLSEHLADVYFKRARFCVMFVSAAYATKVWPIYERRHAVARAIFAKSEYILPVRFDDIEVPGLAPTVMYLRWTNAENVAKAIIEKLGCAAEIGDLPVFDSETNAFGTPLNDVTRYSSYNIAVIGKAGVGKSSLINYLFDKAIRPVDSGGSVTPMGFHKQQMVLRGVPVTIFDSGGLDISNLQNWQALFNRELETRKSSEPPEEWFHSILYCIAAGSDRIDTFETGIIRDLVARDQRVVVVFTKSDQIERNKIPRLRDTVVAAAGKVIPCVTVCSLTWTLPDGHVVLKSGLDELKTEIIGGLWDSISARLPKRCVALIKGSIDEWASEQKRWIEVNTGYFNKSSSVEHVSSQLEQYLYRLKSDIIPKKVSDEVTRTMNMFGSISRMFGLNLQSAKGVFKIDDDGLTKAAKATLIGGVGEIVMNVFVSAAILVPFPLIFRGSLNRSDLNGYVDEMKNELYKRVEEREPQIGALICDLVRVR